MRSLLRVLDQLQDMLRREWRARRRAARQHSWAPGRWW